MSTPSNTYDVVVIGAGLAGALVARRLAEASLTVVTLESRDTPGGLANHGAGLALLGTPHPYVTLQQQLGEGAAREAWTLTRDNLKRLTDTLKKLGQPFEHVGSFRPTHSSTQARLLQQSVTQLQQDGFKVDLEEATEQGYVVAMRTQDDVAFDPTALIEALLDHPNITLETGTEVQAIKLREASSDGKAPLLSIWARKHYIWTSKVVIAGGAHAVQLSQTMRDVISPIHIHTIDFQQASPLSTPLVLNEGHISVQTDGDRWRMVGWPTMAQNALTMLVEATQQLCPDAPVTARHSGWVAQSADSLPVVGSLPDLPGSYIINGLGPWGTSWAFVAVDALIELMLHDTAPGLLDLNRFVTPPS